MSEKRKSIRSAPKGRPSVKHRVSVNSKSGPSIGLDHVPKARRTISGAPRGMGMNEPPGRHNGRHSTISGRHSTIERGHNRPGGFIQRMGSFVEEGHSRKRKKKKLDFFNLKSTHR